MACGLARSLVEKKRSFVTGKAERGLYSSHAERYPNVTGIVDTPLRIVQPNVPIIFINLSMASSEMSTSWKCISMMGEFAFDLRRFKILVGFPQPGDVGPSASTTISCGLMSMRPATLCWS